MGGGRTESDIAAGLKTYADRISRQQRYIRGTSETAPRTLSNFETF